MKKRQRKVRLIRAAIQLVIFYLLSGAFFNGICGREIYFSGNCSTPADCLELIS